MLNHPATQGNRSAEALISSKRRGRFSPQVEIRYRADVEGNADNRPAVESVAGARWVLPADGVSAVEADAQAVAAQGELADLARASDLRRRPCR